MARNSGHQFLMVFLILVSITGPIGWLAERQKRQEKFVTFFTALSQSLERLEVGYWQWDTGTDELYWSAQFRKIYGVPGESIATYAEWEAIVHPEDREFADRATMEVLRTGLPQVIEYRVIDADGKARAIRDSFTLAADGETMIGAVVLIPPGGSVNWQEAFRSSSEKDGLWARERNAVLEAIGLDPSKSYQSTEQSTE